MFLDMALMMRGYWCARWFHDQRSARIRRYLLALAARFWSWSTALHTASLGTLEMMGGDPFLGVTFGAGGDCRTVGRDINGFGFLDRFWAGPLLLLQLGKVRNHPDVIERVANTNCAGEEEEVQEDPTLSWLATGRVRDCSV